MNRIIIYVGGGMVQSVHCDDPSEIEVQVFDVDNMKSEEGITGTQIDVVWDELSKGTKVVY